MKAFERFFLGFKDFFLNFRCGPWCRQYVRNPTAALTTRTSIKLPIFLRSGSSWVVPVPLRKKIDVVWREISNLPVNLEQKSRTREVPTRTGLFDWILRELLFLETDEPDCSQAKPYLRSQNQKMDRRHWRWTKLPSVVTKGGSYPQTQQARGAKQCHPKYFTTNKQVCLIISSWCLPMATAP